jgi:hypothetical protein
MEMWGSDGEEKEIDKIHRIFWKQIVELWRDSRRGMEMCMVMKY